MTSADAYRATIESGDRSLLATYRDAWSALCDEGPCRDMTYRPEWVDCFLDAYHPNPAISMLVVRDGATIRGLLPLVVRTYGFGPVTLRRATPTANYHTWDFDLIHGSRDREAVIAAAADTLRTWRGVDLLQFASTPDSGAIAAIHARWAGTTTRRQEHAYVIPCPPAGTTLAATVDASVLSRKTQMKRHLKKLEARDGLARRRFDRADGVDRLLAATGRYIALELAGWKGSGRQVDLADSYLQAYYRTLAERGYLIVHEIWIGDDLVASHLGIIDGDRMITLRFSYDERFADTGPGNMVILWVVKDAGDRACRIVDLGGSGIDQPTYKEQWTDQWYGVGQYGLYAPHLRGRLTALGIEKIMPGIAAIRRRVRALPMKIPRATPGGERARS